MSQERPRKIPINNRVVDLLPTACTALAVPRLRTTAGVVLVRRNVRHVHQIFFEPVTIENIAARAFQVDAAAWLAGLPFVRWKFLASIPQRIFRAVQSL